ncbi:unnamed protein product, partial [Larinioides sclopetarius]
MFAVDCVEFFEDLFAIVVNLLDVLMNHLEQRLSLITSDLTKEYDIVIHQLKSLPSNTQELFKAKEWLHELKSGSLKDLKRKLQNF